MSDVGAWRVVLSWSYVIPLGQVVSVLSNEGGAQLCQSSIPFHRSLDNRCKMAQPDAPILLIIPSHLLAQLFSHTHSVLKAFCP